MGVGLLRSLQPPDILWIHWRVYNFIVNTSKRALFLPPSDAYVRSFLYLLYTLIKNFITQKLWAIKPHLWPRIEFSPRGQQSRCIQVIQQQPFIMMEKALATHSSTLAWKLPWTEEPGRLQSMGSLRVRHSWATSLLLFSFMHWRRKWQPTPVFLPGESQGRRSLVGYCLWGRTESDTTDVT